MKLGSMLWLAGAQCLEKVIVGYYASWIEDLPFDRVTHINYAFGTLTNKVDPASIFINYDREAPEIRKLKRLASESGVKVLISIGGWFGSQTFSQMVADPKARARFIDNAMWFLRPGMELDGIDLDWEYPGRLGARCNTVSPYDSGNYLTLLQELRSAMDFEFPNERRLLTAAVNVLPFDGPDGRPMDDVSKFAKYFDFVNVMAYDIMGSWSDSTGPNSPSITIHAAYLHP
ncbi:hypothetical protein L0F63_000336 [Massospora cicadina]|nr:hypothetical protein L0F63_000336 [Massospora cicadina]